MQQSPIHSVVSVILFGGRPDADFCPAPCRDYQPQQPRSQIPFQFWLPVTLSTAVLSYITLQVHCLTLFHTNPKLQGLCTAAAFTPEVCRWDPGRAVFHFPPYRDTNVAIPVRLTMRVLQLHTEVIYCSSYFIFLLSLRHLRRTPNSTHSSCVFSA